VSEIGGYPLSAKEKQENFICNGGIACQLLKAIEHRAFCPVLSLLKAKESLRETPGRHLSRRQKLTTQQ